MTAAFADDETWHVLMAADDMKRMDVEQLADAFRLSLIDASTLVWQTGMQGWRRLGSIADVEDEVEELPEEMVVEWYPPAPPRPVAYQAVAYQAPRPAPTSFYPTVTQTELVAPVYAPASPAIDPYVFAQRRVELPDNIDFRRAPGSVRWGRWFVAMLLVTGGVVGAYRQNLLRDGARRIGIESTYLASEQRVTSFINAKAPASVKGVLTRLALLPGPNAAAEPALLQAPASVATFSRAPVTPTSPAIAPPCTPREPEVKTVSLNSLPVLGGQPSSAKPVAPSLADIEPPSAPAPAKAEAPFRAAAPAKAEAPSRPSKKQARREAREESEQSEPIAKAAPKPKAERKPKPEPKPRALPPPPADDNPLKAAMRQVVASDAKKLTARRQGDD